MKPTRRRERLAAAPVAEGWNAAEPTFVTRHGEGELEAVAGHATDGRDQARGGDVEVRERLEDRPDARAAVHGAVPPGECQ
jgi:hypothetical protein